MGLRQIYILCSIFPDLPLTFLLSRHTSLTIPPCDILIHCGDITFASRFKTPSCRLQILHSFGQWLSAQKQCTYKVVVGGNHDKGLEESDEDTILRALSGSSTPRRSEEQIQAQAQAHAQGVIYLNNEYVTVEGLGIFGSPYSKGKSGNAAFQSKAQAEESMLKFAQVLEMSAGAGAGPGPGPADTKRKPLDVLVCHSNSLEPVLDAAGRSGEVELPKLSLWGHYHAKYGVRRSKEQKQNSKSPMQASTGASAKYRSMMSVCACSVNEAYNPVNSPIIIDVPRPTR